MDLDEDLLDDAEEEDDSMVVVSESDSDREYDTDVEC